MKPDFNRHTHTHTHTHTHGLVWREGFNSRERERERERESKPRILNKPFTTPYLFAAIFFAALFLAVILFRSVSGWTNPTSAPGSGNGVIYNVNGNTGINSVTPQEKMYIAGNPNTTDVEWVLGLKQNANQNSSDPYGTGIKLRQGADSEHNKWSGVAAISESAYANSSGLALYANEVERVRIRNNGNVGIGTTTPAQKLSVAGVIESTTGGFKFPDGSVQATTTSPFVYTNYVYNLSATCSGGDWTNWYGQTIYLPRYTRSVSLNATGAGTWLQLYGDNESGVYTRLGYYGLNCRPDGEYGSWCGWGTQNPGNNVSQPVLPSNANDNYVRAELIGYCHWSSPHSGEITVYYDTPQGPRYNVTKLTLP